MDFEHQEMQFNPTNIVIGGMWNGATEVGNVGLIKPTSNFSSGKKLNVTVIETHLSKSRNHFYFISVSIPSSPFDICKPSIHPATEPGWDTVNSSGQWVPSTKSSSY